MGIKNKIAEFFQNSSLKPLDLILILLFSLAIGKIFSLYFSVENEEMDWESYRVENNCRLKLDEDGYESSTWVCQDGNVHYGWRQQR